MKIGVKKDDKIAVISTTNRTEWCIVDIGVLQLGAQNVPIYPSISADDYKYILKHSQASYCFVSDKEVFDKIYLEEKDFAFCPEVTTKLSKKKLKTLY